MSDCINYNITKLKKVFKDFYNVTGINIILVTADNQLLRFNKIRHNEYCQYIQSTAEGKQACLWSDTCLMEKCRKSKKCEIHICHAGLADVTVPLMYGDVILGYLVFGQLRSADSRVPSDAFARELFQKLPFSDDGKIESIRNIAEMLAKYILFEDMLKPELNSLVQKVTAYIDENLATELTTDIIAKNVSVSKSTLYHNFNKFLKCTVSEYVNTKRVERSMEFLKDNSVSIDEVSRKVGYSSSSYYVKKFKEMMGITPGAYRRNYEEHGSYK